MYAESWHATKYYEIETIEPNIEICYKFSED